MFGKALDHRLDRRLRKGSKHRQRGGLKGAEWQQNAAREQGQTAEKEVHDYRSTRALIQDYVQYI
ncbi:hypothetical protein BA188_00830 [Aeromonas hydrophila]|nr:hypothetical protein OI72_08760 [Aeromonas hydrophila]OFC48364.1 hypothetical protein BA189_00185 [Aeromonas hydrophila]OFC53702.1 hypothetical protein BA188_00830 [Aeromonas hydrophila]